LIKEKRLAVEKHGRDHLSQDWEVEWFKRHGRRSELAEEKLKAETGSGPAGLAAGDSTLTATRPIQLLGRKENFSLGLGFG
jgi:hypothetical protein